MPLYEYQCDACGHRFEKIQKFSDPPIEECPNCGQKQVRKLVSSPAIQFKGSGWYITDYAKKGGTGDGAKSDKPAPGGTSTESSSTKSTESGTTPAKPSTPSGGPKDS
jgi:putative FmdB family regulatory protein